METLTAVQVALLTIYDMCKAVDRGMVMHSIKLLEKSGGKSGNWIAEKVRFFFIKSIKNYYSQVLSGLQYNVRTFSTCSRRSL
jgi:hypothetical protein